VSKYTRYYRRDRAATIEAQQGARSSAREILPILFDLVDVRSIVDVGSGVGTWLSVATELGVEDVVAVDGSYVPRDLLLIAPDKFVPHDLTTPLVLGRSFDVALSLEVGEHLPAESAQVYVDSLTALAPVVLFSAAIPFQPGDHHINCQWPEYWAERFRANAFHPVDCIRRRVWNSDKVDYWYIQNTLLFVRDDYLEQHERLKSEYAATNLGQLSLVHPRRYTEFWSKTDRERMLYLLKGMVKSALSM
jgi:SAM-dependent methyltransferase